MAGIAVADRLRGAVEGGTLICSAGARRFLSRGSVVAGVTQLVECQLPKLKVAGSSPVSRLRIAI